MKQLDQSQQAKKKNLAQWRSSRLHDIDLPSGLTVTVRDVTMTDLLLTGKLPPAFVSMAEDAAKNSSDQIDLKAMMANAESFAKMLNELVTLAMVSPKIGTVQTDEMITLDEMPNDDKMAVFNWVNREVTQLTSFREG